MPFLRSQEPHRKSNLGWTMLFELKGGRESEAFPFYVVPKGKSNLGWTRLWPIPSYWNRREREEHPLPFLPYFLLLFQILYKLIFQFNYSLDYSYIE